MRVALIENNVVVSISEWDGTTEWTPLENEKIINEDAICEVGYKYDGSNGSFYQED